MVIFETISGNIAELVRSGFLTGLKNSWVLPGKQISNNQSRIFPKFTALFTFTLKK